MAKLDGMKEKLGIYKLWLTIIVGVIIAVGGWCITTFDEISRFLLVLSIASIAVLIVVVVILSLKINDLINDISNE